MLRNWLLVGFVLSIVGCTAPLSSTFAPADIVGKSMANARALSASSLALAWAPIHYQDADATGSHGLAGKADFITAINFDGDWVAKNNWNNAAKYPLAAHGYYSVVETITHWFLIYAYYHPRDWTDNLFEYGLGEHENDVEGCLLIVQKDGTSVGKLQGMITVFHSDFYSFTPEGSPLQANQETIDGKISLQNYNGTQHPLIAQEAKGHGLKAWPYVKINSGDGLISYPSLTAAGLPKDLYDTNVSYKLVDIFEANGLWDHREDANLFESDHGSFLKSYGSGTAHAPWKWDDANDQPGDGELAKDPAHVASVYFTNFGAFSTQYLHNQYQNIP